MRGVRVKNVEMPFQLVELPDEALVRLDTRSPLLDSLECLLVTDAVVLHQVGDEDGGTPADAHHAVY